MNTVDTRVGAEQVFPPVAEPAVAAAPPVVDAESATMVGDLESEVRDTGNLDVLLDSTLTVTVDQESKLHQQLLAIMLADDVGRNQVFPGLMTDKSSNAVSVYQNMFIENDPDESRATESATFAWVMGFERKIPAPNPGDDNIVGT